jgi:threonine dehydrogenase-like Zn-dependent dehydrogenase
MRAVVVTPDQRTFAVADCAAPRLCRGTDVLLRTIEVGVCATDREICAFEYGAPPAGQSELILGHEALAEVIETGPDVQWASAGDLVVPTVRRPCPVNRCAACRQDHADFCSSGAFTERGIVCAHGYLCESFVEDERYLVPVPSAIREVAVLTEPLSVIAKAVQGYLAVRARLNFDVATSTGLVLGAGPIGLLAAMTLRAYGIKTHVFSREPGNDPRAGLARAVGAHYISAEDVPLERIPETTGRYDVVFEAVGVPQVAFGALPTLAPNGVFLMTGIPARRGPMQADLSGWMRELVLTNQLILGTVSAGRPSFEFAIRALEQFMTLFPEAVRCLVQRVPLERAPEVLARSLGIKDVVTFCAHNATRATGEEA